jgi:hypothetical protein
MQIPCSLSQLGWVPLAASVELRPVASKIAREGEGRPSPKKEGILRALLSCQAQNRTTISSKSGGSHTLKLTGTATRLAHAVREDDLKVGKESDKVLMTSWVNIWFLEVNRTAVTGRRATTDHTSLSDDQIHLHNSYFTLRK